MESELLSQGYGDVKVRLSTIYVQAVLVPCVLMRSANTHESLGHFSRLDLQILSEGISIMCQSV